MLIILAATSKAAFTIRINYIQFSNKNQTHENGVYSSCFKVIKVLVLLTATSKAGFTIKKKIRNQVHRRLGIRKKIKNVEEGPTPKKMGYIFR